MTDSRRKDSKKEIIKKDTPLKMTKESYSNTLTTQNSFNLLIDFPTPSFSFSKPSSSKSPSTFIKPVKSPPSVISTNLLIKPLLV